MPIGRENIRIRVERCVPTQSPDSGEEICDWQLLGTPFAEVEPLEGNESFSRGLAADQSPSRFRFRYALAWADLSAKDRIVIDRDGRIFDIRSVARDRYGRDRIEVIGVDRRDDTT
jgi:head-tail adaptor